MQDIKAKVKVEAVMTINKPVLSSDEIAAYGANGTGITVSTDYDMFDNKLHSQEERRLIIDDGQGRIAFLWNGVLPRPCRQSCCTSERRQRPGGAISKEEPCLSSRGIFH
jgi:hypothetical protein